ncbi:GNAT family N-acetyltransferase [Microvirga roseola]|uniref:GNAT family N-acetyltransferase n=1 Tax=Microvirga roseola TaxID=2883126 RepID=UPI001E28A965|nr:GNAT family N-acetyltransferase [Microvirga roseola]
MSDIRLLDARDAERDRARLAETLADCVAGGAPLGFRWPFPVEEAHRWWGGVIDSVAAGNTLLFGAYVDGRLCGTVQLGFDGPCNQRHRGDVRKLLVHRDARGKSLGTRLMASLQDEAGKRSLALLTLETATGSEAERLYWKLGYTKAGEIPNYALMPDGRPCATSLLWKALG